VARVRLVLGGIKLIQLDPATGKRLASDPMLYALAYNKSIEASYIYRHGNFYYLFVNWGICCRGVESTYEIRVGRSEKITGPYLDKAARICSKTAAVCFLAPTARSSALATPASSRKVTNTG